VCALRLEWSALLNTPSGPYVSVIFAKTYIGKKNFRKYPDLGLAVSDPRSDDTAPSSSAVL